MKYKMKDVRYIADHGNSDEQCLKCRFFYPQYSLCQVVYGTINPNGWCMKYLEKQETFMFRKEAV